MRFWVPFLSLLIVTSSAFAANLKVDPYTGVEYPEGGGVEVIEGSVTASIDKISINTNGASFVRTSKGNFALISSKCNVSPILTTLILAKKSNLSLRIKFIEAHSAINLFSDPMAAADYTYSRILSVSVE